MPEPGAGRPRRLAEELEESGLVLEGSAASRPLLLEEVDHALRPEVHERRVVSSGTILEPRSDPSTWESGTQLGSSGASVSFGGGLQVASRAAGQPLDRCRHL